MFILPVIGQEVSESNASPVGNVSNYILENGNLVYTGNQTVLQVFPGFTEEVLLNATHVTSLTIQHVAIHAFLFSKLLVNFTSLESIVLDNVSISESFDRVLLPNLTQFTLNQLISSTEKLETYQEAKTLHSNLFFDKSSDKVWDINDVCDLGVDISYTVNGFKLVTIKRNTGAGEIELNLPYCNDILTNVKGVYSILSLMDCPVTESVIPIDLKYLNLHSVTFSEGNFTEIVQHFTKLEYLYANLSGVTVDLTDIPQTVTHLSLSNVGITNSNINLILTRLTNLSIGDSELSYEFYSSFPKAFPSLQQMAAFGPKSANYKTLEPIISTGIWILMEDFDRTPKNPTEVGLEINLEKMGIPNSVTNFMVIGSKYSNGIVASPVTEVQSQEYRYTLLGWEKFVSFDAFGKST